MSVTTHLKAYLAVGSMLVGGLLAGCASAEQAAAPGDAVHVVPLKANRVAASRTAPKGTTSSVWSRTMVSPRSLGEARVYLGVVVPVCSGRDGVFTLTTTTKRVEIGYWVYPEHPPCAASITYENGYIQLPAAIGQREVVHVPPGRRA